MVIYNLNIIWAINAPEEADTPLIINSNAVLAGTIAGQLLQSIPWWRS